MKKLKIAAAQICVTNDIEANEQTINRAVDFAIAKQADILLTPEGSLSGYHSHFDVIQVKDALSRVTCRARKSGIGLALGTCYYEDDGLCYN